MCGLSIDLQSKVRRGCQRSIVPISQPILFMLLCNSIFREIIRIISFCRDRETKFTMAPPKKIRIVNQPSTSSGTSRRKKKPESDESDSEFLPSTSNSISKPKAQPNRKAAKKTTSKKMAASGKENKIDENANNTTYEPQNILSVLSNLQNGGRSRQSFGLEHCARSLVVNRVKDFCIYKSITPFDRRTTALTWHPKKPNLCAVGSKGGEIIIWNYERDEFEGIAESTGPGGSIQKIMFDPNHQTRVYTCSIDGTFELKDLGKKGVSKKETFLKLHTLTQDWDKWYTSFDIAPDGMTLLTGENTGYCTLLTNRGEQVWKDKLHKSKVTNIGKENFHFL